MPHRLIPTGKRCCGYGKETERGSLFLPGYTGDYPQVSRRRELGLLDEGAQEILRCAQDDKPLAVILSAAKDLERAYG